MRLAPDQQPFDTQRHFGEVIRTFLPILVLVIAAGLILYLVTAPADRDDRRGAAIPEFVPPRVGLLPVEPVSVTPSEDALERVPAEPGLPLDPAFVVPRPLELARAPEAPRFDLPMGSPLGALTYNAQPFLTTRHLGDDLNGIGGWDSDLGDPVYAAGDGQVVFAGWPSDGWGNVVMLLHRLADGSEVTTFYGHLESITVPVGGLVRRGHRIGTVGKADGRYLAHLHFEIRPASPLSPGAGYADAPLGRQSGEFFLSKYRGAPEDRQNEAVGGDWDTRLPKKTSPSRAPEGPRLRIQTETGSGK